MYFVRSDPVSLPINSRRVDPRVRRDELCTWRVEEEWCVMSRSHESTRRTRWRQVWSRRDELGSWRDELVGDETNRPNSRRDDLGSRWDELGTQRDKPEYRLDDSKCQFSLGSDFISFTFGVARAHARAWAATLRESEPAQISVIFSLLPQTAGMR